jgi:hypothetical protein
MLFSRPNAEPTGKSEFARLDTLPQNKGMKYGYPRAATIAGGSALLTGAVPGMTQTAAPPPAVPLTPAANTVKPNHPVNIIAIRFLLGNKHKEA